MKVLILAGGLGSRLSEGEIDELGQEMDALCSKLSKLPDSERNKLLKMIDIMLEGSTSKK
jgi:hypothetical protein